jgi:hypothetical protein
MALPTKEMSWAEKFAAVNEISRRAMNRYIEARICYQRFTDEEQYVQIASLCVFLDWLILAVDEEEARAKGVDVLSVRGKRIRQEERRERRRLDFMAAMTALEHLEETT